MERLPTRFLVTQEEHRLRVDRYLRKVRPDLSRRAIEELLRSGAVTVHGKVRGPGTYVKHGDEVVIGTAQAALHTANVGRKADDEPSPVDREPRAGDAGLHAATAFAAQRPTDAAAPALLLRTPHLAAVGKPPGLATNPTGRTGGRLLRWLEAELAGDPPAHPPGIVHRLDRDTSGLLLFSLSPEGHRLLLEAFARGRLQKTYLGLVAGSMRPHRGSIDLPLARDSHGRMRPSPRGANARTRYETLRVCAGASLLRLRPEAGRMHQIRVHLASVGHPLLADPLYGLPREGLDSRGRPNAPRLWLHAWRIDLEHALAARLGSPGRIECPLWADLAVHLNALGIDYDFKSA